MHPLWAGHKERLLTFKSLDSAALKLEQFTAGKLRGEQSYIPGGSALFQKQTPCGNPLVQQGLLLVHHWVKVERHPKAETSMSLLGPGSQRMEQEKRCSRFPQLLPPQHPRAGQGCSASGPCLPGDRTAAAPASVHPTPHRELELLPPSLLTLPSFPTPSSSALSLSVIKRIEVEMNSQILSLQLFPLSVLAPAQNSSTSLWSWLQQAQLQPLHLTCPWHSHNIQPASSNTHRENLQILLEIPLPGKKCSWT